MWFKSRSKARNLFAVVMKWNSRNYSGASKNVIPRKQFWSSTRKGFALYNFNLVTLYSTPPFLFSRSSRSKKTRIEVKNPCQIIRTDLFREVWKLMLKKKKTFRTGKKERIFHQIGGWCSTSKGITKFLEAFETTSRRSVIKEKKKKKNFSAPNRPNANEANYPKW